MTALRALTGNIVYNHFGHPCPYRLHRDLTAPRSERTKPHATGRYLMERGNRHEETVFRGIQKKYPDEWISIAADPDASDRIADIARRAAATEKAMAAGVRFIFHGIIERRPLRAEEVLGAPAPREDLAFRGETDILIREEGSATPHRYIVGDVKSSLHAKFTQKMQVAFYSWIIAQRQGSFPETGFIITGSGTREDFLIDDYRWTLKHFIEEEIHEFVESGGNRMHMSYHCDSCHWFEHCHELATTTDDLSLIPTCRRVEKRALNQAGIATRASLLEMDEKELRTLGRRVGTGLDCFRDLKKRATAQEFGRPVVNQHPKTAASGYANGPPDLYRHRGPILIISSIPDHYHGDEALLATSLARREQLLSPESRAKLSIGQLLDGLRPDQAADRLPELLGHIHETSELLVARQETLLFVLTDEGLPSRLRKQAAGTMCEMPIETLLTDATFLPKLVRRTWFLATPTRDLHEVAKAVQKTTTEVKWSAPEAIRNKAQGALDELAEDYGLNPNELIPGERNIRPLIVQEWRASGDEHWRSLLEFDMDRERAAACDIIAAIMGL